MIIGVGRAMLMPRLIVMVRVVMMNYLSVLKKRM